MKHLLLLAVFVVAGCATTNTPISENVIQGLPNQTLVTTERKSPDFIAMTSAKGMFALAGVALAISEGNELVKDDNISDPSGQIAENLAEQLTGKYGMNYAGKTNGTVDGDSPVDISQVANGNAYAIDVETTGWSYMYDGFNFSDYFVTYTAEMKLVDLVRSSTVAKGRCLYSSKDVNGTVREEKLTKNNSAYIKEQLAEAVVRCSDEFGKKVLNL